MGFFKKVWGGIKKGGKGVGRYFWNIAISIDQLGNTLIGFLPDYGDPDETISSVLGRRALKNKTTLPEKVVIKLLDLIDASHVFEAIEKPTQAILYIPRKLFEKKTS